MADVTRVEVDGLPVAPSLRASSVVRRPEGAEGAKQAAKPADELDAEAYMAEVEAMKARGEDPGTIAVYSRRYLAATEARGRASNPMDS